MIPENFVMAWQEKAPWQNYSQTEQDLVISRAIVEIFSSNLLKEKFLFRTQKLNTPITRARFEKNLSNKFHSQDFKEDIKPLLRKEIEYNINNAFFEVHKLLISKLNGKPYAGGDNIFE